MDEPTKTAPQEPLPIWFFVGMILLVYGLIILGSGLLSTPPRPTVLAETRPALWWGGFTALAGAVFLALGLGARRSAR